MLGHTRTAIIDAVAKDSRVPPAVGAIPVVGDLMKQADNQARWMQELVEQNARLAGQLPATLRSFNDSLERFNQTVARLDRVVGTLETLVSQLAAPLLEVTSRLDRAVSVLGELPGAGLVRRLATGRSDAPEGDTGG